MNYQLNLTLLALSTAFCAGSYASGPVETLVPIKHVYSPKGFDSNDATEVMVSGYLPNLCYRGHKSEVSVQGRTIKIRVTSFKDDTSHAICTQMVIPFLETVPVGQLDKGDYEIIVDGSTSYEHRSMMQINEAISPIVDDYVYASVDHVNKAAGTRLVQINGYNPSDCYELDRIKLISNGQDTYSVLPIMKQVYSVCPLKLVPFSYAMEVPVGLKEKELLLHVRAMDGKSVNTLFTNKQ